jgi:hypothetical protein
LGFVCGVCDRIWFQNDLNRPNAAMLQFLQQDEDVQQFMLCSNCWTSVKQGKVPTFSKSNGFTYPPKPTHLPPLDALSERLISPRLPFMQMRHLRYKGKYGMWAEWLTCLRCGWSGQATPKTLGRRTSD